MNSARQPHAPTILVWSTDQVAAACRLDYFADAVSSTLTPMAVHGAANGPFRAYVRMAELGALTVLQTVAAGTRPCVARDGDCAQWRAQLPPDREPKRALRSLAPRRQHPAGDGRRGHRGLALWPRLPPGRRAFASAPQARARLAAHLGVHSRCAAGPCLAARIAHWARALIAFASELSPELALAAPLPGKVIADQIGSLLALTAHDLHPGHAPAPVRGADLRQRARDCIAQRCAEPELDASAVATSLNISVRTLHRVFAAAGETFGAVLLAARCDTALRMLESSVLRRLTLEHIGRRAGFSDPSHFSRTMRSRFGASPRGASRQARLIARARVRASISRFPRCEWSPRRRRPCGSRRATCPVPAGRRVPAKPCRKTRLAAQSPGG